MTFRKQLDTGMKSAKFLEKLSEGLKPSFKTTFGEKTKNLESPSPSFKILMDSRH